MSGLEPNTEDELPKSIIVTNVDTSVFDNSQLKVTRYLSFTHARTNNNKKLNIQMPGPEAKIGEEACRGAGSQNNLEVELLGYGFF